MTQQSKISFTVGATGPDLHISVRLDGDQFWQGEPGSESKLIDIEFDDGPERDHILEIEMSGKIRRHTVIDANDNIVQDRMVQVKDITIDDIALGHMFTELAEYHHDYNGTGPAIVEKFYGDMGCNGVVRLKFFSPVYLWLLENL